MNAMQDSSGRTPTLWLDTQTIPQFEALDKDIACDVVVVGGGIGGLSTAYQLGRQGLSVVVLEDGNIGSGETGRTSAHLSNALDDRYYDLETYHGKKGARLAAESHAAAIDWIENVCNTENIACDFRRVNGYLILPPGGDQAELEKEFHATQRAGLDVQWAPKAPWPTFDTGKCLVFGRQAEFHPAKYLAGLARCIPNCGGRIFTRTHAQTVVGGDDAHVQTTGGQRVSTKHIVVATNVPINERLAIHTKQAAYRTYVIAASVPTGTIPHALYWDTLDPYHYLRVAPLSATEELLIVGGEDHKTGQQDPKSDPYERLETWTRARFPQIGTIRYRWSGQVVEPTDGLAYIGRSPLDQPNVYLVTGDSGNGLTHGTIGALLIADLIQGRSNAWAALYDPDRVSFTSSPEFVKENANTANQYLDWLTPGEVKDVEAIAPGEGAILRSGLKKLAVSRNSEGKLCALSAVCPHLGALVTWNPEEKTWDCPAHGSRFSPDGQVVNGPANAPLQPAKPPEKVQA